MHTCRPRHAGQGKSKDEDYSPLSGQEYFAQAMAVKVSDGQTSTSAAGPSTFRVYYTPPSSLKSATTSSEQAVDDEDDDEEAPVVYVCHHGAGYSAMSFALLSKELVEFSEGKAGVLALDCRGHGQLHTSHLSYLI